jgi:hypothetical protein
MPATSWKTAVLAPKAFETLRVLIEHRGHIVEHDKLIKIETVARGFESPTSRFRPLRSVNFPNQNSFTSQFCGGFSPNTFHQECDESGFSKSRPQFGHNKKASRQSWRL